MPRTITESEYRTAQEIYNNSSTDPLRAVFEQMGISIVPDPLPEPDGNATVLDCDDDAWIRVRPGWWQTIDGSSFEMTWEKLNADCGPLKVQSAVAESDPTGDIDGIDADARLRAALAADDELNDPRNN